MSCRGIWPREATPTTVTTVQAAHAAIARYVAGGPTMSWVGCGVSVRKDQGPRCPGSGPMIVCTAPPTIGLAIMLRRGSLPTTLCIEASLIAHSPPLSSDRLPAVVASQLCTSTSVRSQHASDQRVRCRCSRGAIGQASYARGQIPPPGGPMPCRPRAVARPVPADRRHRRRRTTHRTAHRASQAFSPPLGG